MNMQVRKYINVDSNVKVLPFIGMMQEVIIRKMIKGKVEENAEL